MDPSLKHPDPPFRAWKLFLLFGLLLAGLAGVLAAAFALQGKAPMPLPAAVSDMLPGLHPLLALAASVTVLMLLAVLMWRAASLAAPGCDPVPLLAGFTLAGMGYLLLVRLAPDIAAARGRDVLAGLAGRQFAWLLLGVPAFLVGLWVARPSVLRRLARRRYWFAVLAVALIAVTGLFGQSINGRRLWLPLGPFQFQTIELVKLLVIFFAASFFAERSLAPVGPIVSNPRRGLRLHVLGPFAVTASLFVLPVIAQGDLGPALLLSLFMLLMFHLAEGSVLWPLAGLGAIVGASVAAYTFGWPSMVRTPFDMWLDPFHTSEVLSQSLWALADGGLFGTGFGQGWSGRIPIVQSDFNFTAWSEETGWVGGAGMMTLYAVVACRGLLASQAQSSPYRRHLATGISCMIALQALIIVGGNMGMLPLTGITLPFVSYGGSSLLVSFFMLGLLAGCSGREEPVVQGGKG